MEILPTCSIIKRSCLHTSCHVNVNRQLGNAMKKALGYNKKKKFHYNESYAVPIPQAFDTTAGKRPPDTKRSKVLNKLFMRHITDLMATGEHCNEIIGHGIQINKIKVAPDYKILNVFWIAKASSNNEVIDRILEKNAGYLRHELSQLRILGKVPIIQFVRDKYYSGLMELDNRLAVADYGENYVPQDLADKLKSQLELYVPLDQEIKEQIQKSEAEINEVDEISLPPMSQNVLGLDHADILKRIKISMRKSEALHRKINIIDKDKDWASFKVDQPVNGDPVDFDNIKSQQVSFKEFLYKRQLMKLKSRKERHYSPDTEYIGDMMEKQLNYWEQMEETEDKEEDYIIEEINEKMY